MRRMEASFKKARPLQLRFSQSLARRRQADEMREAFGTTPARMHSHPDFGLANSRVFARRKAHVAGEHELTASAADAGWGVRVMNLGQKTERKNIRGNVGTVFP
jgi:hypothetical protein